MDLKDVDHTDFASDSGRILTVPLFPTRRSTQFA